MAVRGEPMSMKLMKQNKGWRPRSPVYFMNFWADSLPTSLLYISILLRRVARKRGARQGACTGEATTPNLYANEEYLPGI